MVMTACYVSRFKKNTKIQAFNSWFWLTGFVLNICFASSQEQLISVLLLLYTKFERFSIPVIQLRAKKKCVSRNFKINTLCKWTLMISYSEWQQRKHSCSYIYISVYVAVYTIILPTSVPFRTSFSLSGLTELRRTVCVPKSHTDLFRAECTYYCVTLYRNVPVCLPVIIMIHSFQSRSK